MSRRRQSTLRQLASKAGPSRPPRPPEPQGPRRLLWVRRAAGQSEEEIAALLKRDAEEELQRSRMAETTMTMDQTCESQD